MLLQNWQNWIVAIIKKELWAPGGRNGEHDKWWNYEKINAHLPQTRPGFHVFGLIWWGKGRVPEIIKLVPGSLKLGNIYIPEPVSTAWKFNGHWDQQPKK